MNTSIGAAFRLFMLVTPVDASDLSSFAEFLVSLLAEVTRLFTTRQFLQFSLRPRCTGTIRKLFHRNNPRRRICAGIARTNAKYVFRKSAFKIGGDTRVVSAVLAFEQVQHPRRRAERCSAGNIS